MLKKIAKAMAVCIVFGLLPFIPNVKGTPMVGQEIAMKEKEIDESKKNEGEPVIFEFPPLKGPYNVGLTRRHIIDHDRKEPHNPTAQRELMLYIWYPAQVLDPNPLVTYCQESRDIQTQVAQAGFPANDISSLDTIYTHAVPNALPSQQNSPFPVIFFSHGYLGCTPEMYTAFCEELASHGYVIISISHTYFATMITFPDGRQISAAPEKYKKSPAIEDQELWFEDTLFALDQVAQFNADRHDMFFNLCDMQRVGMFGHSFGGSTAYEVCLRDSRFKAGINLDGGLYGENNTIIALTKPFMSIFAQESLDYLYNSSDEELAKQELVDIELVREGREKFRKAVELTLSATLQRIIIPDVKHAGFSDLLLLKELSLYKNNKHIIDLEAQVGTADGFATIQYINECMVKFFDQYLKFSSQGGKNKFMITKELDQDTQLKTSSGCTFTAQKGWFVTHKDGIIVLQEPDRELTITLVENTQKTAEQAVLVAWQQVQPNFARTIQHKTQGIPQDGWDEIVQCIYDTATQEGRFIVAIARRVGKTWYVQLVDGTKAAVERRMAGVLLINSSFKVPGTQEESFANKKVTTLDAVKLQEFMTFVQEALVQCKVPGAAVGIVQNGKIVFEQGLGVRSLDKQEKVTPQTLFMIGSTTKALTTFMMARLVDEGKFTWDTPVTQVMPEFVLGDEITTKQVLMKHMVSASTGIPRQDIEPMFNYDQATPELRIKEMQNMKPTTGFGETFQYSNAMVCAGGYIAAHSVDKNVELGKEYDAVMQSRVFGPMDMQSTTFDFAQVEKTDYALPHGLDLQGNYVPFADSEEKWVEAIRPAGGAWSNVHDMAQYMITELNNGVTSQGKRVISEDNLHKRREPQIKITDKMSYGLGLIMENDHGVLSIGHDGGTMGFSSLMFFLPENKVGLVMLTNARAAGVFTAAVKRKFMELLFNGKEQAQQMVTVGIEQQKKMFVQNCENINFKPDAVWLKNFVGTYTHPTLGSIVIREVVGGAELDARVWKSVFGQKNDELP